MGRWRGGEKGEGEGGCGWAGAGGGNEKGHPARDGLLSVVGPERFELSTFRPPDGRANQAAPRPDTAADIEEERGGAQAAKRKIMRFINTRLSRERRLRSQDAAAALSGLCFYRSARALAKIAACAERRVDAAAQPIVRACYFGALSGGVWGRRASDGPKIGVARAFFAPCHNLRARLGQGGRLTRRCAPNSDGC